MRHTVTALALVLVTAVPLHAQDKEPPKAPEPTPTMSADDAVDLAMRILDEEDEDDAEEALEELREMGGDGIWDLLEAAKEYDEETQEILAKAIAELGKEAVPELIRTMNDEDEDVRETAIFALEELGEDALDGLMKVIKDGPEQPRLRAAILVGKLEEDGVPPLIQILKYGPNELRELAATTLTDIGGPAIVPLAGILGANKESHDLTRNALFKIGSESVAAATSVALATQDLLRSKTGDIREAAVVLVGKFGGAAAMPKVIEALCSDDEAVRFSAAECAATIGEPAIPDLIHCLNAGDKKIADLASLALSGVGEPAVPALMKMLKAPMPQMRAEVIAALGSMKRRASTPDIAPFVDEKDQMIRDAAREALYKISGGKAFATRSEALAWWEQHKDDKDPPK